LKHHYGFSEIEMWAMPVRRFKRMHKRIAIHRAQAQLDLLEVVTAPHLDSNEYEKVRNAIVRVIDPSYGVRIIKLR
jgi:hypothetical protein